MRVKRWTRQQTLNGVWTGSQPWPLSQFPDPLLGSTLYIQGGDSPRGHVTCSVGLGLWVTQLCPPGGSDGKEFACSARDSGSIPGLGRSPGEGNGYPLQYSCLENPLDRGTWWATVQGVTESDMSERLTPPPPPPRRRQYSILLGAS